MQAFLNKDGYTTEKTYALHKGLGKGKDVTVNDTEDFSKDTSK